MVPFIKTKLQLTLRLSSRAALYSAPKTQPMGVDKRRGTQQTCSAAIPECPCIQCKILGLLFTYFINGAWGVYSVHFFQVLILLNDWSCGVQVRLNSAAKEQKTCMVVSVRWRGGTPVRHMRSKKQTRSYLAVSKIVLNLYGISMIFRLRESVHDVC